MVTSDKLISGATATGIGGRISCPKSRRTIQAVGATTGGTGAAVIKVYASNVPTPSTDLTDWILIGTISLTLGTTNTSDGFASDAIWKWLRPSIDSISGTGAAVDVYCAHV